MVTYNQGWANHTPQNVGQTEKQKMWCLIIIISRILGLKFSGPENHFYWRAAKLCRNGLPPLDPDFVDSGLKMWGRGPKNMKLHKNLQVECPKKKKKKFRLPPFLSLLFFGRSPKFAVWNLVVAGGQIFRFTQPCIEPIGRLQQPAIV